MTSRPIQASILLAGALCVAAATAAPASQGLDVYRWRKRVVVVFAPAPDDARLARQRAAVGDLTEGSDDRDLVLVQILGGRAEPATLDGPALRRRFNVAPGAFRALLIGKDGGVKLDEAQVIEARRLADTIDAMPMRRDETTR
jgi:hypothetical protein